MPSSARYAGAILKSSFDEVGQQRSVTVVDIDAVGAVRCEEVALAPRRELRRIEGTLQELLLAPAPPFDDYIVARLLDRHPVLDPIGRLRAVYPNVLSIERPPVVLGPEGRTQGDRRQQGHGQLFAAFFQEVTGQAPSPDEQAVFDAAASKLADSEREVLA
jgi:exonuclease SbcD